MYNVIFLNKTEAEKLAKVRSNEKFNEYLLEIKNNIENNNIDQHINQLQYILCKLVGFLEFKKNDEELQDEIYDVILTEVLYPLSDWLKHKRKYDKNAETCFNILKNEIFLE